MIFQLFKSESPFFDKFGIVELLLDRDINHSQC